MALHAQVLAQGERLVRAMHALEDPGTAGRNAEGLAVPVKGLEAGELTQPFARHRIFGDAHLAPADLLHGVGADTSAEGPGHELATEAVPEHRDILAHRVADQLERRNDPRQLVVHAHRPAHERETRVAARVARHAFALVERDQLPGNRAPLEIGGKIAGPFGTGRPKNSHGLHA